MLILGSQSPRRKEILSYFSVPFEQLSPDFDETQVLFEGNPAAFACEVAHRKALSLKEKRPHDTLLTADTVVYCNQRLYQKPESLQEAHAMLNELSGKRHEVFTGVAVLHGSSTLIEAEKSSVYFTDLTDTQIQAYHQAINPLDKAGGYAIQGIGAAVVKRIEGCYYNIMGLPVQLVRRLLMQVGIDLWDYVKNSL
jgi:septum formation protein